MKIRHTVAALAAGAAAAMVLPSAAFAQININGSIDRQVAPFTPAAGRVFRDGSGNGSVCGVPKAYPGTFGAGQSFAYRVHTVVNNGPAQCVTVTVDNSGCAGANGGSFPVMYTGTFNPAAPATGYVGDGGTDPLAGGAPVVFGVTLGAGEQVDLVLFSNGGNLDPGSCNYNITSAQLNVAAAAVPTLGEWAMIALGGLLAAFGFVALRSRRRAA
jgi:hypothetical protein